MSYILDSLKKSDQERQKGAVPGLNSYHGGWKQRVRVPSLRLVFLLGPALLLNGFVFGLWLEPWRSIREDRMDIVSGETKPAAKGPASVQESAGAGEGQITAALRMAASGREKTVDASLPEGIETAGFANPGNRNFQQVAYGIDPSQEAAGVVETAAPKGPDPVMDEDAGAIVVQETPEDRLEPAVPALPGKQDGMAGPATPSRRRVQDDFHISAHFYSRNSAARLISINGRILREGQESDGLMVEEITDRGVIVWHQGERKYLSVY